MTSATTLTDGLVRIERKKVAPITVAPLGDRRIDKNLVGVVLAKVLPTAIVLISKSGHYDWDARELAMTNGSTILTVKELYTFMHETDPRPFLDKNVSYNRERLEQHSRVVEYDMICESSLRLRREGALSDVVIAIEYEYEFSEEAAVRAISRHPDADIILNANPNGSATTAAYSHARDAQVPIYKISELMGALNYDGDQLRNYEPPKRR
ncbi:hypothetical protein ACWEPL_31670 [Nonomuraea sp. NPDC004186]